MSTNTVTLAGKTVVVDEEGFLEDRSYWNEDVAEAIAKADGIELTPEHWEVINFMREYYEQFQISPNQRMLPMVIGKKLGPEKGNKNYLYKLFPLGGPAKQAYRYAGLPRVWGTI
jgi:tRNA 2-thiouridine synthesizing protein E